MVVVVAAATTTAAAATEGRRAVDGRPGPDAESCLGSASLRMAGEARGDLTSTLSTLVREGGRWAGGWGGVGLELK